MRLNYTDQFDVRIKLEDSWNKAVQDKISIEDLIALNEYLTEIITTYKGIDTTP